MDAGAVQGFLWLWTLVFVALLCLLVAWIVLPFAVLGTKPLLRELVSEQRRTNELLARLAAVRGGVAADARSSAALADEGRLQYHQAPPPGRVAPSAAGRAPSAGAG